MASRRLRKKREDPVVRLALSITTPEQARRGDLRLIDVSNHDEGDQRHMTRGLAWDEKGKVKSGERMTIRHKTLAEKLRWHLDEDEAAACQWYSDAWEARYCTIDVIGNYGDIGRGKIDFCHLAKTTDQDLAGEHFTFARAGISPPLRPMFERIVLHGWPISTGITTLFRLAARQLMHRIEGQVSW